MIHRATSDPCSVDEFFVVEKKDSQMPLRVAAIAKYSLERHCATEPNSSFRTCLS